MLPYTIKALKLETGDAEITKLTTGLLTNIFSRINFLILVSISFANIYLK